MFSGSVRQATDATRTRTVTTALFRGSQEDDLELDLDDDDDDLLEEESEEDQDDEKNETRGTSDDGALPNGANRDDATSARGTGHDVHDAGTTGENVAGYGGGVSLFDDLNAYEGVDLGDDDDDDDNEFE